MAAPQDELLGLDVEFDLADAAAPELKVGAGRRQAFVSVGGMDLALDRVDVGDRREVEIAPPDERLKVGQKGLAAWQVAGHGPGLDEGRALPVLADTLVVAEGEWDRHGHRRRRRVGAQAQVDPEDIAFQRARLEQLGEALGEADGDGGGFLAGAERQNLRVVEDRDVDIAGIVELEGPVLAHGDDEQPRNGTFAAITDAGQPAGAATWPRRAARVRAARTLPRPAKRVRLHLVTSASGWDAAEVGEVRSAGAVPI